MGPLRGMACSGNAGFSCRDWGFAEKRSWSFLPGFQVLLPSLHPPWPRGELGEQWAGHMLRLRARPLQANALHRSCLAGTRDSGSELQGPWPPLMACVCAALRCLPRCGRRAGPLPPPRPGSGWKRPCACLGGGVVMSLVSGSCFLCRGRRRGDTGSSCVSGRWQDGRRGAGRLCEGPWELLP